MGFFSFLGATVFRPYTRLARDLLKTGKAIKSNVEQVSDNKASQRDVEYIGAPNAKKAFQILFEKNGWTEEELVSQRVGVRRTKWICITGAIISIVMFFGFGLTSTSVFFTLFTTIFSSIATAIFSARALQFAIFQTQIDERCLLSFREFMARPDFWQRVFS